MSVNDLAIHYRTEFSQKNYFYTNLIRRRAAEVTQTAEIKDKEGQGRPQKVVSAIFIFLCLTVDK